jgi:tetratricopeptide (TPR) repeat protein
MELFRIEEDIASSLPGLTGEELRQIEGLAESYSRTGDIETINKAIDRIEEVMKTKSDILLPISGEILYSLLRGTLYGMRYERTRSLVDLNRAVGAADEAVKATPLDHPDRASCLNNLGKGLGMRFERTGAMDDLNHAIEATDEAVKTTPSDHPNRAGALNNLGDLLGRRFEQTGAMDDLNRAVEATDKAVKATPSDHPDRAVCLNNLGIRLGTRFRRTGAVRTLRFGYLGLAID